MKKLSLLVALIMAITVFWIPGSSVAFADEKVAVSFEDYDGTVLKDAIEYDSGTAWANVEKPSDPSRTGYTFAGWKDAPETVTENFVAIADYTVNKYTITFNTAGGSTIAPITQDYDTPITAPANPTRSGYTFAGWDKAIPAKMPAENMTITAKWTENPKFNQGSVSANQTSVTFNWSWTNGNTGTVSINLNKRLSDRNSSYSYNKTITNAKSFSGLSDGTTYNYVITATPANGTAQTYRGTVTTAAKKANGWLTVGNDKYYYINGVKQREATLKLSADGARLNHYFDCNGIFVGRRDYMYSRIKGLSSKTYLVCVDRTNNVVCVYKGGKNKWRPYKYWSCVTGRMNRGDYHPTPLGVFKVKSRKKTFSGYGKPEQKKNRYSVWHCTRFVGSVFFHSQLYKYKSKKSFIPGGKAMGVNASHGCVRLHKSNAYWIYKNCKKGTTVVVIQ